MKSLFSKIRQIGTNSKKSTAPEASDSDTESESRSHPFPRVAQSRNDSHVEVSQSVYGRATGATPVRFIVNDILGKGHYGLVFLAQEEVTGKLFAVKVMKKEVRNINKYAHIEEAVLRMCRVCPFIIHMFSSFQTTNSFYLVMEYAEGGNLKQIIDEHGTLTIQSARFLSAELVVALHFLHNNGVIHRDLKIQNILMTNSRHMRLIDFGLSRMDIYEGDTTNSGCGTPFYMAPEILRRIPYSHEVDWWALGVVLYKIVTGMFPFMGKTNPEVFVAVTRDSVYYDPHLPSDLVALFKGLLKKNPSKRLGYGTDGWRSIQAHPFFSTLSWTALKEQKLTPPPYGHVPEESDTQSAKAESQDCNLTSSPLASAERQRVGWPQDYNLTSGPLASAERRKVGWPHYLDRNNGIQPARGCIVTESDSAAEPEASTSCPPLTTVHLPNRNKQPSSEDTKRRREEQLRAHYPFIDNDFDLSETNLPTSIVIPLQNQSSSTPHSSQ